MAELLLTGCSLFTTQKGNGTEWATAPWRAGPDSNRLPPAVLRDTYRMCFLPGWMAGERCVPSAISPAVLPGNMLPDTWFHSKGLTSGEIAPGGDGMPLISSTAQKLCAPPAHLTIDV